MPFKISYLTNKKMYIGDKELNIERSQFVMQKGCNTVIIIRNVCGTVAHAGQIRPRIEYQEVKNFLSIVLMIGAKISDMIIRHIMYQSLGKQIFVHKMIFLKAWTKMVNNICMKIYWPMKTFYYK